MARQRLEFLLAKPESHAGESVDSDPKGAENGPHQYNYKPSLHPQEDTVIAPDRRKSRVGEAVSSAETPAEPQKSRESRAGDGGTKAARTDGGTVMRLSTDELTQLAPRLRLYLKTPRPAWADIVEAADWLRGELGVSKSLWGEACLAMGRERAAIAIAVVSIKDPGHFRTTPGGYFHGMVTKAKAGALNLDRTLWGMRRAQAPKPPGRGGERGTYARMGQ